MSSLQNKTQAIYNFSEKCFESQDMLQIDWNSIEKLTDILSKRSNIINTQTNGEKVPLARQIGLILLYGAIHYCFTHPISKREYVFDLAGKKIFRSSGFVTALKESDISWESFEEVSHFSIQKWFQILQTQDELDLFQLRERYNRIIRFSKFLVSKNIVTANDFIKTYKSANAAIELMVESGLFADVFLKRAQVTAYLISATLQNYEHEGYPDVQLLTAMPDYRLPQLLYNSGVVILSTELKKKLVNETPITKASPEENALRSSVIIVVREIAKKLNKPESVVDSLMWGLVQKYKDEGALPIPSMLVETNCY